MQSTTCLTPGPPAGREADEIVPAAWEAATVHREPFSASSTPRLGNAVKLTADDVRSHCRVLPSLPATGIGFPVGALLSASFPTTVVWPKAGAPIMSVNQVNVVSKRLLGFVIILLLRTFARYYG